MNLCVTTDFAVNLPHSKVSIKVKERYGLDLSASSISQTTMIHARSLYDKEELTILLSKNHGDKTMPIRLPPKAKFPIEMDETFVGGATQIDFFCQVRIIL